MCTHSIFSVVNFILLDLKAITSVFFIKENKLFKLILIIKHEKSVNVLFLCTVISVVTK